MTASAFGPRVLPGPWLGDPVIAMDAADAKVRMASPTPTTGAGAVRRAQEAQRRRATTSTADVRMAEEVARAAWDRDEAAGPTRMVGGRVFRLRGDVWTDVAFRDGGRLIEIRAYGAAYFDVVRSMPELELVLRELDAVVVAGVEVAIRVSEEGLGEISPRELEELVEGFRGEDGD